MAFVGGSVAVSSVLADAPVLTAQAARYAAACLALTVTARVVRRAPTPLPVPRGREWLWLLGVTGSGLVLFNLALVHGTSHAEPAILGVAVSCVPLVLAVLGPAAHGRRPDPRVLLAAATVTVGGALVYGHGRCDAVGLGFAVTVLCCEAGFTLFAVPLLDRLGPWGVSVHTTWLAAVAFTGLALVAEGPDALTALGPDDLLAVGYLAAGVTALAFVLWYSCVAGLGPGRAGLLSGVAPVTATAVGVLLGETSPRPLVWLGVGVVAGGLALGLSGQRHPS